VLIKSKAIPYFLLKAGKKLSYPELPELYGVVYSLRLN